MKYKIKWVILTIIIIGILFTIYYFTTNKTRINLMKMSEIYNPTSLKLEKAYNPYVTNTFLDDGTEVGIIQLKDASNVKYWFKSHHITNDFGGTLFQFNSGNNIYMKGFFCCEVQLPDKQSLSKKELMKFIKDNNNIRP